jgi:hypothetical protein
MKRMKIIIVSIALAVSLCLVGSTQAKGTFQNLNFELAMPSTPIEGPLGPFYQPVALALPFWTAYLGTNQQSLILQNSITTGAGSIDIFGPSDANTAVDIISGNYSVMLQAGAPFPTDGNASIEQNGTIPANALSIEWKAWDNTPATALLTVSFGGNSLSPVVLGSGANYMLYGADVSAFAGQTGELEFTSVFNQNGPSWIELDDITLSTSAVPEPGTLSLLVMGGLTLAVRRWRAKGL